MTILDARCKKVGVLSAAAVAALVIFTGCNGPTIMENREGVPSAIRELGHQKDHALPGNAAAQDLTNYNNADTGLIANDKADSSFEASNYTPSKAEEAEFYAVEFPRMEDMSKKTVGPKKETSSAKISASSEYYVVVKGDSVGSIAKKFKVKRADLIAVNNISDPNKIHVGQKLKLPTNAQVSARAGKKTTETVAAAAVVNGLYTVKPNDSISKIAKNLKITRASLMQANNLNENSILRIGQKLVIPNAQTTVVDEPKTVTGENQNITDGDIDALTKQLDNEVNANTTDATNVITPTETTTAVDATATVTANTETATPVATEIPSTFTAEQDTKLEDICKKYNLDIENVKLLNVQISADGVIKAGETIFLQ